MKFPKHIILDVKKPQLKYSSQYWIFKYLLTFKNNPYSFEDLSFHKRFFLKKENLMLNRLLKNQKKFTIRYNYTNPSVFMSSSQKKMYKNLFNIRVKVKHRLLFSKHHGKVIRDYLVSSNLSKFDEKTIKRMFKNFKHKTATPIFKDNLLWSLFDINFLRKEKIYTKLKYSRVPQYDIVAAGVSALFAAFIGFLITEKFGFELLDSGDFYFLFMYLVFLGFFGRMLFKITTANEHNWNALSYKWFLYFYKTLFSLLINFFKKMY